jgi:hypothetical protein
MPCATQGRLAVCLVTVPMADTQMHSVTTNHALMRTLALLTLASYSSTFIAASQAAPG